MSTKAVKSRSLNLKLSVRTLNDLEGILLEVQEGRITKRMQRAASLLRGRLDRAHSMPSR